jgi:hypothetical protein
MDPNTNNMFVKEINKMNKLMIFFFLSFANCKSYWSASVAFNKYGWLPWDVEGGVLIYYSGNQEYKCEFPGGICESSAVDYIPNTYILRTSNFYFYNDDNTSKTCSFAEAFSPRKCYQSPTIKYISQFESISFIRDYIYVKNPTVSTIEICKVDLTFVKTLNNSDYRWHFKDTLYGFKVSSDTTKVTKYMLDGSAEIWSQPLSYCFPKDPDNELFVSVSGSLVFVICSSINLIYKLDGTKGNIIVSYPLDSGNVKAFDCTSEFIFVLYGDANIVQYTLDFNYVYTYGIENSRTPKYNILKVDNQYIFCVLCSEGLRSEECLSPVIYQWSIEKNIPKKVINYSVHKLAEPNSWIKLATTSQYKSISSKTFSLENSSLSQIYSISPISYKDRNNQHHLIYFSGGGNAAKGLCGDFFLHDIIISELIPIEVSGLAESDKYRKYLFADIPNYSLIDYAAFLFPFNDSLFYIIHGGISCDFKTIFSTLFAIEIYQMKYIKVLQEHAIA